MLIDKETIQKAKEALGDRNAEIIQSLLHMEKYNEQRKVGCCPNPNHNDHNPSCSYNPKTYNFHCFSCGFTIDVISAYMMAEHLSFVDACKKAFEQADIPFDFSSIGTSQRKRDYRYPKPKYADNKVKVYSYWATRGISKETIDYLDIQQDLDGNTLFQYYDLLGTLVTVKVRKSCIVPHGERKIWHLKDSDHMDILYNMNRVTPTEPLVITSGEGDCAAAIESGVTNVVSIHGGDGNTRWISECWDWLQQFPEIILVPDNDESGRKFAKDVSTRLGEYRVKIADVSELGIVYTDLDNGGTDRPINDLNELLTDGGADAVREVIKSAKDMEIPTIVDYTDVKRFDMSEVPGFISGLQDLDNALDKFYMGSTTILTGTAGSGKTSLLSTLICQSVEQGFPVFVYSGELSNPTLKSWIDFVHAGQAGVIEYPKTVGSGSYYRVSSNALDKINRTYAGKVFFYKDTFDQKVSKVMSAAESVVRRYGVKTLIFDNMTSLDLECNDTNKWQKQEEFIRDVIAFGTRWNVCCIVVLHPKKMDMNRKMSLYDLSGVMASVNLSHRVFSLYRVSDKEKRGEKNQKTGVYFKEPIKYDVTLDVLKDRYGSGAGREIGLYYDVPSKRFFDTAETLGHRYEWAKDEPPGEDFPYGIPQFEAEAERDRQEQEWAGPHQPQ